MTDQAPRLIDGGLAVDDRGQITFVNGFDFEGVKRFYMVSNHTAGFVRAWHAHRRESKYVFVPQGAVMVGAVRIDQWDQPSKDAEVHRYVLSAKKPAVLFIPPGYANGFMNLSADTSVIFFSSNTLEDSMEDDVRYEARHWDIWTVDER